MYFSFSLSCVRILHTNSFLIILHTQILVEKPNLTFSSFQQHKLPDVCIKPAAVFVSE